MLAAVLMLAVGTIDDVREVSPPAKVAGIVLSARVLVLCRASACCSSASRSSTWSSLEPELLVPARRVVWVLAMTNAINLIDGLDGLAAGIVAIAAGTFFLYAMQLRRDGCSRTATSRR